MLVIVTQRWDLGVRAWSMEALETEVHHALVPTSVPPIVQKHRAQGLSVYK